MATPDVRARQMLLACIVVGLVLGGVIIYRIINADGGGDDSSKQQQASDMNTPSHEQLHDEEEQGHVHKEYKTEDFILETSAPTQQTREVAEEFTREYFATDRSEREWLTQMEFYCEAKYFAQLKKYGMSSVRPLPITGEPEVLKSYDTYVVYSFPAVDNFTFVVTVSETTRGWRVTDAADVGSS